MEMEMEKSAGVLSEDKANKVDAFLLQLSLYDSEKIALIEYLIRNFWPQATSRKRYPWPKSLLPKGYSKARLGLQIRKRALKRGGV